MTESFRTPPGKKSMGTLGAFFFGLPLGVGILAAFYFSPLKQTEYFRYVSHPVECVEIVLFCCGLGALLAKVLGQCGERLALRREMIPAWNGQASPAREAEALESTFQKTRRGLRSTLLGRRIGSTLEFVRSRGSANQLDDHLRCLADNDALAQEESYSLLRFITWAIPILGFLGTVLGITGAIAGVTPEILEKSLSHVTDGLALAFDTTAVALALTMILMFCNFLVERLEQGALQAVDAYVDRELAHRFERTSTEGGDFMDAVRQSTQVLTQATEKLVEHQAQVWERTWSKTEQQWVEAGLRQQELFRAGLEQALERSLMSHTHRLVDLEERLMERAQGLVDGFNVLAGMIKESSDTHQETLASVAQAISRQAEALANVQQNEMSIVRLQESLQQNLAALANTGTFERSIESLTAAIHLLTAKAVTTPTRKAA